MKVLPPLVVLLGVFLSATVRAFHLPRPKLRALPSSVRRANAKIKPWTLHVSTEPNVDTSSSSSLNLEEVGLKNAPISLFGAGNAGASADDKHLLGGKGANLAEMSAIGLSVPHGFTITTECCKQYCSDWKQKIPPAVWNQVVESLKTIESSMGSSFGDASNPLLLSVRSGAAISMPGMMDTVLNLGMNDAVCEGLAAKTGNPRFAWDSYRRFLEMFGNVVLDIPRHLFEDEIDDVKYEKGVFEDGDLTASDLKGKMYLREKIISRTGLLMF